MLFCSAIQPNHTPNYITTMSLKKEELDQIISAISHELNGKLDAKLAPIHEELVRVNSRLDKIDERLDAHYHLINKLEQS